MAPKEHPLDRFRRNPKNVRADEIETFLVGLGFRMRQKGTSHAVYSVDNFPPLIVPFHRPIKEVYVKKMIKLLEKIAETQDIFGLGEN